MAVIQIKQYDCVNRERPNRSSSMLVQEGWKVDPRTGVEQRNMVEVVSEWQDIACGHVTSHSDPLCADCKWKQPSPEKINC